MFFPARILNALNRKEEAEDVYRSLLERNPDSHELYRGFMKNKGLDLSTSLLLMFALALCARHVHAAGLLKLQVER